MKTSTHSKFLALFLLPLVLLFGFGFLPGQVAHSDEMLDTVYVDEVNMILGELTQLKVYSLTRLSMTDPEIADVVDADDSQILLIAKNTGQTPLFIWDEYGKRVVMINVAGTELKSISNRIQKLLSDAELHHVYLDINGQEGKVVITGAVPDYKQLLFEDIIAPFDEHIISLVHEREIEDLVQIDVQITELSTTLTKSLGFDWSSAGGTTGSTGTTGTTGSSGGSGRLSPAYRETLPDFDGSIGDFFK
ncbi:MAG: pilus assembly protein N-terminal domain-containing protein, partial [Candidatus Omnitrophica bacterium]|nr:pilus assembly protein N-terminal domain-containing protein [Candidatus Omnitrophota bacterium]